MIVGTLYVVATPIGNLDDITLRALQILKDVDLVAAEDTRHTGKLLQHFDIATPTTSCHDHNELIKSEHFIEKLRSGQSIALVSDAGTPLISDPGYRVVKAVREAGIEVCPIPGACAAITALSASGLASDRFFFEGFLPSKSTARKSVLKSLSKTKGTLIFYESPRRILASLSDISEVMGAEREVVLARELTKTFETIKKSSVAELIEFVDTDTNQQRGEIVLLIAGRTDSSESSGIDEEQILTLLLEELSPSQAAKIVAKLTGEKKKTIYKRALEIAESS